MSVSTKFLVTGMLISGVCNTILNKLQDMQCVENCDQETNKKYFEQPVWQTLNMFIGETLCFLAGYVLLAWEYHNDDDNKGKKNSKGNGVADNDNSNNDGYLPLPQGNNQTSIDNTDITSNADNIIVEEDINVPTKELKGWKIFLFWFPTMCDICGTTLMNVGLIYTTASVYQMLRGAVVLFTGTFSVLFLRRHLYPYHWFSLLLVVLGVTIVGMSSVLFPPKLTNDLVSSDYDDFNNITTFDNSIIKPNNDKEDKEVSHAILGIFCIIFAQVFTASQFVLEEKIMETYHVKPLKAVGYEGIFGLGTVIFGMIILHFTIGVHQPDGYFNIPAGWNQIISYQQIWVAGIAICFSIAFFNFFGLSVTRTISATSRSTIDTSRIVFIWMVSLVLGWEVFSWLQVFGFIILILGTFIFNNVMRPPPCFSYPLASTTENQPLLPEDEHI
nr:2400_t:CDS:2 [Entrophospora candida]